ncbi:hypothetical protein ACHAWO_008264 [Cyclotella atomus]|uniref:Plastid lipid-associated protein/fibrillin conserved domain-containing protein n=1 Tax=Cyclotella atomus TaxID=382360 RepID=A0ABD3N1I9_9STRA
MMNGSKTIAAIPLFLANLNCSSSFHARHATRSFSRTTLKSSISHDQMNSKMGFDFPSIKDSIESEFKSALDKARDIDKRYGLCTEPSQQAWSVVDSLYAKMQMFQGDDTNAAAASYKMQDGESSKNTEGKSYFF